MLQKSKSEVKAKKMNFWENVKNDFLPREFNFGKIGVSEKNRFDNFVRSKVRFWLEFTLVILKTATNSKFNANWNCANSNF